MDLIETTDQQSQHCGMCSTSKGLYVVVKTSGGLTVEVLCGIDLRGEMERWGDETPEGMVITALR